MHAPETVPEAARALDAAGTIARGLGRSYGDAAVNADRAVVLTTRLDRLLSFDAATGVVVCEAGVSLAQLIERFGPQGFFPAITPGTKLVTVGGCIANDVHGKAHHAQGSFVSCVQAMRVMLADGRIVTASRTENADLFWATFGGMGLLGLVVEATLQLRRIETTYFRQKAIVARDLAEMLAVLEENDAQFPYSVATLDVVARGKTMGRGVLTVGDHARVDELPRRLARQPLRLSGAGLVTVPFELPELTLNRLTVVAVNEVILAVLRNGADIAHYEKFFYPLDAIREWNRGYGRRGFIQYQFVIPFADGERVMRDLLDTILSSDQVPMLNILKRMGPSNAAPLSFPMPGYTFAIDLPVRQGLEELARRLDEKVADAGGRLYLGKDALLGPALFRKMYPRIDEWLAVKAKWDPAGVFSSDLGRRLLLSR